MARAAPSSTTGTPPPAGQGSDDQRVPRDRDRLHAEQRAEGGLGQRWVYNTLSDLALHDIGEEGIHLRSNTTDNVVVGNAIERTGLLFPQFGEGVYVGSDPDAGAAYTGCEPDRSAEAVLDNVITAVTAEGIEAKAGTSDGLIRGNTIDGSAMTAATSGGWTMVKGSSWLVDGNHGTNAPGDGLSATFSKVNGWGRNNVFVRNQTQVQNPTGFGVWVQKGIEPGRLRQHRTRGHPSHQRRLPALSGAGGGTSRLSSRTRSRTVRCRGVASGHNAVSSRVPSRLEREST